MSFSKLIGLVGLASSLAIVPVAIGQHSQDLSRAGSRPAPAIDLNDPVTLKAAIDEKLGLQSSALVNVFFDPTPEAYQTVQVPIGGVLRHIALWPHSVRGAAYNVRVQGENGAFAPHDSGPILTVRGAVEGFPGSHVTGAVYDTGVHLQVHMPGEPNWWVESVTTYISDNTDVAKHVVYETVPTESNAFCGTDNALGEDNILLPEPALGGVAGQMEDCFWFIDLAADIDWDFVLDFNSVSGAVNRVNLLVNLVNQQYEPQTGIHHVLSSVIVRNSAGEDPYTPSPVTSDLILGEFRTEWLTAQVGVQRDVAFLFSGRAFNGPAIGQAWTIGGMCSSSTHYAVGQNQNFLSCDSDLLAHELGHLWNAFHCSCPSNTMNPSLTCSNNFSIGTQNSIVAYRNSILFCLDNACIPSNNECEEAILVGNGNFPYSNENAMTTGFAESLCAAEAGDAQVGSDVWFQYDAECDGDVTFDVCASNFNSKIALYQSFCPNFADSAIACSDNDCGQGAVLTENLLGGATYFIRVGGFEEAQGSGTLSISGPVCVPPPANDDCGSAQFTVAASTPFDSAGATTDGPSESGCTSPVEADVWFRYFNQTCDTSITFSVCDAGFDTSLAVYGSSCPTGPDTALGCNDDDCGLGSSVTIEATLNTFYRIRVGSPSGTTGTGTLTAECNEPADCNDNGTVDDEDISGGTSQDCNSNGIPDECDIADATSLDLNANQVPDECEPDCNGNSVPDDLDIANEVSADCNDNQVPDECDIALGTSDDDNTNGIPDECESSCPTDTDGNGATDVDDLVAIILDWGTDGSANNTDVNGSGSVDVDDLVAVILAWGPC